MHGTCPEETALLVRGTLWPVGVNVAKYTRSWGLNLSCSADPTHPNNLLSMILSLGLKSQEFLGMYPIDFKK